MQRLQMQRMLPPVRETSASLLREGCLSDIAEQNPATILIEIRQTCMVSKHNHWLRGKDDSPQVIIDLPSALLLHEISGISYRSPVEALLRETRVHSMHHHMGAAAIQKVCQVVHVQQLQIREQPRGRGRCICQG